LLGKRRSPYDFLFEIVQACRFPAGKTDLYHIIRTTHGDFERWLNVAMQLKLIEVVNDKYHPTQKGENFLTAWQEILQTFLTKGE
jgi:predicted transcriptional regulator